MTMAYYIFKYVVGHGMTNINVLTDLELYLWKVSRMMLPQLLFFFHHGQRKFWNFICSILSQWLVFFGSSFEDFQID